MRRRVSAWICVLVLESTSKWMLPLFSCATSALLAKPKPSRMSSWPPYKLPADGHTSVMPVFTLKAPPPSMDINASPSAGAERRTKWCPPAIGGSVHTTVQLSTRTSTGHGAPPTVTTLPVAAKPAPTSTRLSPPCPSRRQLAQRPELQTQPRARCDDVSAT